MMEKRVGDYVTDLTLPEGEWLLDMDKNTRNTVARGERNLLPVVHNGVLQVFSVQTKDYKYACLIGVRERDNDSVSFNCCVIDKSLPLSDSALTKCLHEAMIWAKTAGFKRFYMGGVDTNPTDSQVRINAFKQGFGGEYEEHTEKVSFINWLKYKLKPWVRK
jgi:hypothetical protein